MILHNWDFFQAIDRMHQEWLHLLPSAFHHKPNDTPLLAPLLLFLCYRRIVKKKTQTAQCTRLSRSSLQKVSASLLWLWKRKLKNKMRFKKNIKVPRMLIPCFLFCRKPSQHAPILSVRDKVLKVLVIWCSCAECSGHLSLLWRLSWDLAQKSFIISAPFPRMFSAATQMHTAHTANMSGCLASLFLRH